MRYLFQGDSITDCGRGDCQNPFARGNGYVRFLEAELTSGKEENEVMNCGIGGNRVVDLLARWKRDCLNLKPDVLTVLIGINDVWAGSKNGVEADLFEEVYRILIRETRKGLPDVRIILMGAYVTHGTATDGTWEYFFSETRARRERTRKLAEEFGADFIDLQKVFDDAQKALPDRRFTSDGVHPTDAGHRLIAKAWMENLR